MTEAEEYNQTPSPLRNVPFTLNQVDFEPPTGYSFREWSENADGSGTTYADQEDDVSFPSDKVLYAQWEPIQYSINYNMNYPSGTSGQSKPTGALESYMFSDNLNYAPPSCQTVTASTVKSPTDYSSDTVNYPYTQKKNLVFANWSPDRLHRGRSGNFTFHANWKYQHLSEFNQTASGSGSNYKNLTNKTIFVKMQVGSWVLSFGGQNFEMTGSDSGNIYLQVFVVQGSTRTHLCNIPIPKSKVTVVSGSSFSTQMINTPIKPVGSTQYKDLQTQTIRYTGSYSKFRINNVSVEIP